MGEDASELGTPGPAGGPARRRRAQGPKSDRIQELSASLDPVFTDYLDGFIFGDIWGRPGLSQDERMVVAITALAALGQTRQLENYLWGALYAGIPASRIQEVLMMMVVYAGFPTALDSLFLWRDVLASARRAGLELDLPAEGSSDE